MVFESLYCTFGIDAMVNVWWCNLLIYPLLGEIMHDGQIGFNVEALQAR
jgi:hypothetical protein